MLTLACCLRLQGMAEAVSRVEQQAAQVSTGKKWLANAALAFTLNSSSVIIIDHDCGEPVLLSGQATQWHSVLTCFSFFLLLVESSDLHTCVSCRCSCCCGRQKSARQPPPSCCKAWRDR